MERRQVWFYRLIAGAVAVLSCWGSSPLIAQTLANRLERVSERPARPLSVRLVPENPTLWGAKASQRFLVLGKYADGLERDLTSESRFSIKGAGVAKVEPTGQVVGLSDGRTTLTATAGGQSVSTGVQVQGSEEKRPFSFAGEMGGIFTRQGMIFDGPADLVFGWMNVPA